MIKNITFDEMLNMINKNCDNYYDLQEIIKKYKLYDINIRNILTNPEDEINILFTKKELKNIYFINQEQKSTENINDEFLNMYILCSVLKDMNIINIENIYDFLIKHYNYIDEKNDKQFIDYLIKEEKSKKIPISYIIRKEK